MTLIQRISKCESDGSQNVDSQFRCEHMGATEFECGILYASLQMMRKQTNVLKKVQVQSTRFWFYGPEEQHEDAIQLVKCELYGAKRPYRELKEPTHMTHVANSRHMQASIGWWWLSQDGWPYKENASLPSWCLFRYKEDAQVWQRCCRKPVAADA